MKISFCVLPFVPRPKFSELKNFAGGEQGRGKIFKTGIKVLPTNKVNEIFSLGYGAKNASNNLLAFFIALYLRTIDEH